MSFQELKKRRTEAVAKLREEFLPEPEPDYSNVIQDFHDRRFRHMNRHINEERKICAYSILDDIITRYIKRVVSKRDSMIFRTILIPSVELVIIDDDASALCVGSFHGSDSFYGNADGLNEVICAAVEDGCRFNEFNLHAYSITQIEQTAIFATPVKAGSF